jgi:hypothetical protein
MKRFALPFMLLVITAACSGKPSQSALISGPTPVDAAIVVADPYSFDATQLGRMTLTNAHATSMDYTFVVWRYVSDDEQVNKGQASYRLGPGETRVLTVGVREECGAKYQRTVSVGIAGVPGANPFTMSDLRNYVLYAAGALWIEPACDLPAVTPPPPPPVTPPPPPPVTPPPPVAPPPGSCTSLLPVPCGLR